MTPVVTQAMITAISAGSAQLATDQAALNASTAAVAADITNDAAADAAMSQALLTQGQPSFTVNADGTATIYAYAATPPGYTIAIGLPAA